MAVVGFFSAYVVISAGGKTQTTTPKLRLAKILLARSYFFNLCSRFRLEVNHGGSAKSSVSCYVFASVRFVPSSRSIPPGGNAVAELPTVPFAQFLRRRWFFPAQEVEAGGDETTASLQKW